LGNFDARSDEGMFFGYSTKSKAYRCFNKILRNIVKRIDVKVVETMNDSIDIDGYVAENP
jgi:hypothetical protein